jgi:hypothetical protein
MVLDEARSVDESDLMKLLSALPITWMRLFAK